MNNILFRVSEVVSFIEDKLLCDMASQAEMDLYSEYKWSGKLKANNTYKQVLKQMHKEYRGS